MENQSSQSRRHAVSRSSALPTLEDVAKHAGVSTATVSRCLNFPERVQEDTRLRVMASVQALGYAPNFGARALAAKRTNTFGVIIPTMENAIFARGLQAFQEELGRYGVTTLVASSSYRTDLEEEQIRTLVARGADALLLIGHDRSSAIYDFLDKRNVPYLVAWVFNRGTPRLSIGFDNFSAMKALTRKVIDLGHCNIGFISAARAGNDRAAERVEGALAAMQEAGLDPEDMVISETAYSIENGAEALSDLITQRPSLTAVLCGNDVLAAGALARATDLGLRIPDQISITGFDDIEIARIVTPRLTTVHVPHREMGRRAAQILVEMREGRRPDASIELPAHLIMRGTLGPARD